MLTPTFEQSHKALRFEPFLGSQEVLFNIVK